MSNGTSYHSLETSKPFKKFHQKFKSSGRVFQYLQVCSKFALLLNAVKHTSKLLCLSRVTLPWFRIHTKKGKSFAPSRLLYLCCDFTNTSQIISWHRLWGRKYLKNLLSTIRFLVPARRPNIIWNHQGFARFSTNFRFEDFSWMLLRATENTVAGHMWRAGL